MEDEILAPPEFKEGFNKGYIVAKYHPDSLRDMPQLDDNSHNRGFLAGMKEWEAEKAKNYFKQFDRGDDKDKVKDKDIKK